MIIQMRFFSAILAMTFTLPILAQEEEHGVGRIVNNDMNLSYIDHVLSGEIAGEPILAKPLENEFGISLWHRSRGEEFETIFKKEGNILVGEVNGFDQSERRVETQFKIHEISSPANLIIGQIDNRFFKVRISSETMNGNHYVNPTFKITFQDGALYEFTLDGGEACMGCAAKLSYVIISILFSNGIL